MEKKWPENRPGLDKHGEVITALIKEHYIARPQKSTNKNAWKSDMKKEMLTADITFTRGKGR